MIRRIFNIIKKTDQKAFFSVLLLSIIISLIEVIGVSAIMPFISLASDLTLVETNAYFKLAYDALPFNNPINFAIAFGIALLMFYLFRGLGNAYYFYRLASLSEGQYLTLASRLFKHILQLNNADFATKNSASLTKTIVNEASYMTQVISAFLLMLSESVILLLLYVLLLIVNWKVTLILSVVMVTIVFFILKKITRLIKVEGVQRESSQHRLFQELNNSFGNFKLIKLFSVEKEMLQIFRAIADEYVKTNILFQTLSHFPRLILDFLGFGSLIIIVISILYIDQSDIKSSIAVLSFYVVALYRLLPSMNRIITNFNKIMFYQKSLDTINADLQGEQEELGHEEVTFDKSITFNSLSYGYGQTGHTVLQDINISFKRASSIAVVGESGSGKSTFIDLLIGLNQPSSGTIDIDNTPLTINNLASWRRQIGYIPQNVYLFDSTVAENVVFGRVYDEEKIKDVLRRASILTMLETKEGIHTMVGENGKLLSGGQKQRIAIARALYGDPEILVMDEATSALDEKTEQEIMQSLYALQGKITLFIITHNIKITAQCDHIYTIEDQQLKIIET